MLSISFVLELDRAGQERDTRPQTERNYGKFILTFLTILTFITRKLLHLILAWGIVFFWTLIIDKNNIVYLQWFMIWYELLSVSMKFCLIAFILMNLIILSSHAVSSFRWRVALNMLYFSILSVCRWKSLDITGSCGRTSHLPLHQPLLI